MLSMFITAADALWTHDGHCVGAAIRERGGGTGTLAARGTVLATGGSAALWQRTTNPRGAIGSGLTLRRFLKV